ncbi:universal stress protein [Robertkochia solimangrovi]|uniref:universal stress protein n=1 Tax=Robertkochia solimangrovi TaxID=2213046 RepID=UPI0013A53C48|nr:universal stress protein [Robertkochia solimangrovi]
MKKVLLPTDFSENAWNAISYAIDMFSDVPCEFYILHTYVPAFYRVDYALGGPAYSGIDDAMIQATISGLEHTLERIHEKFNNPKHKFHTHYAFNQLTDEIREYASEQSIDMIIMGTKGASGVMQVLLGSNTVFVMRTARIPVLAIPEGYTFKSLDRVLFPTDYLKHYEKEELGELLDLCRLHGAEVQVVHVDEGHILSEEQESNKKFLEDAFQGVPYSFALLDNEYPPDAIKAYTEKEDFDLLVMMNRKHSFMERLLLRQNVDSVGFEIKIPFLVLREKLK